MSHLSTRNLAPVWVCGVSCMFVRMYHTKQQQELHDCQGLTQKQQFPTLPVEKKMLKRLAEERRMVCVCVVLRVNEFFWLRPVLVLVDLLPFYSSLETCFLHLRSLLSGSLSCLLHIYLLPFSPSHFLPNVLCIPAEVKTLTQGQKEFRDLLQDSITPMQDTCPFHSLVLFYSYCYVTGRPFLSLKNYNFSYFFV